MNEGLKMNGLRFLTAGESHGRCLVALLEGLPKGVRVRTSAIDAELARRQQGYGRGGRMTIETDRVQICSGIRRGVTDGTPIALRVENRDFKIDKLPVVKRPRPGHADLVGAMKYDRRDIRDILERASARETAARVAAGAVCKEYLRMKRIDLYSHVLSIGGVKARPWKGTLAALRLRAEKNPVRCADAAASKGMIERIEEVKKNKDTAGGLFELRIQGVPSGLGAAEPFNERLDYKLMFAVLSIHAVKAAELVSGIRNGFSQKKEIVLRAAMKPIATLMSPLHSVNIDTKAEDVASIERSDVTAVPACGVVAEAMAALALADWV